jgi:hypothetical protein
MIYIGNPNRRVGDALEQAKSRAQIVSGVLLLLIGIVWCIGLVGLGDPDPDNLEIYWKDIPLLYLDIVVHGILGVFNLIVGIALFIEIRHIRLVGMTVCISDILVPIVFIAIWSRIPLIGFLLVIFQILVDVVFLVMACIALAFIIIAMKNVKDKEKMEAAYAQMPPQQYPPAGYGQPPPPMVPQCNACGGPLDFAHQYNRWFCPRCNRYL